MFGGNFAPRGWAFCDGQLLPISANTALFSIIGTIYGGDGRTTVGLPDLRGRTAIHAGTGPGLPPVRLGSKGGSPTETLIESHLPSHTHTLYAENKLATETNPGGHMLGRTGADSIYAVPDPADNQVMSNDSITDSGGGQAFSIQDPYTTVNFIIALTGLYPSRN